MEKKQVKLLAIQMGSVVADRDLNIKKVETLLKENLAKHSADFVFLPEVWTTGWYPKCFQSLSENFEDSKAISMLKNYSREYGVNIIGGSVIRKHSDGTYTNTCPVINRNGDLVCVYDKNHLFSYYGDNEGEFITRGENPILVELDGVKIGLTICYDIRFPEIYRAYRKAGADILVNMAAWGYKKKIPWDSMTTSRAVENQTYFVALTQTGELIGGAKNLGHSMILDYKGEILDEINIDEGAIYANINLNEMYDFRDKCKILSDIKSSYEVVLK